MCMGMGIRCMYVYIDNLILKVNVIVCVDINEIFVHVNPNLQYILGHQGGEELCVNPLH